MLAATLVIGAVFVAIVTHEDPCTAVVDASPRDDVTIDITVSTSSTSHVGLLSITSGRRSFVERRVEGGSCEEVVDALTLIANLAVRRLPPRPVPIAVASVAPRPRPFELLVGAQTSLTSGFTSGLVLGAPVFVDLRAGDLSARGSFQWNAASVDAAPGRARLRRFGGRADLCPLRFGDDRYFVTTCGTFEIAMVSASGEALDASRTASSAWFAPGGLARGAVDLSDEFFVEAELASAVPLVRPRVVVDRDRVVNEAKIIFSASLGAGVRIF